MYEDAVEWALTQKNDDDCLITAKQSHFIVEKVREYFNNNNIAYDSFSYDDLIPYLQLSE